MQALLGKITSVKPKTDDTPIPEMTALQVGFKPSCLLPERGKLPEWLKDQTLTVERAVPDAREVGGLGDSIVLTPDESAKWLYPLSVEPAVTRGALPRTLRLRLRWWKDEKAPEFNVKAGGRIQTGEWAKEEGGEFTASVETAPFFDFMPALPVPFEVTCDKLKAVCTVVPEAAAGAQKIARPDGDREVVENAWYTVELTLGAHGSGIASLREKGREGIDHFLTPENRIQRPLENGGHADRIGFGWNWLDKLRDAGVQCLGARREGGATRVALEGTVDEGMSLRTSVAYTLFDDLPLLLYQRDFHFGQKKEEKKDGDPPPIKEPIDDLRPVRLGFRAAFRPEKDGASGSRILCDDGKGLATLRCAEWGEFKWYGQWFARGGWIAVEHPGRREWSLLFFDPERGPQIATWLGPDAVTLETRWDHGPARPNDNVGFSLGLTAGEVCGASAEGAWVACRAPLPEGGARCAVIGRIKKSTENETAAFALGGHTLVKPLETLLMPGIGRVSVATADFAEGRMDDGYDVTVARIGSRRG